MAEYQIFSDGACDIGFAKAKELGIGLIPFYISIDHETYYKEIQEISLEEYFRYMTEEKGYPKTSLPSIQDYMDAFRPALEAGKDIICITMTRTMRINPQDKICGNGKIHAGGGIPSCADSRHQFLGGNRRAGPAADGNGADAEGRKISE